MSNLIKSYTREDLEQAFPKRKNTITDELVSIFNSTISDPMFEGESLLQSAVTYEKVMQEGKYKFSDYIRAVKFCAYLGTMDDSYVDAYKKAFWDRDFVKQRINAPTTSNEYKELTSAASRYRNTNKLVSSILTYSQVPENIFYGGYRMKAMGVLYDMMYSAKSDMVKVTAAKELLNATKGSEKIDMKLDVEVKESNAVAQLQEQLMAMAGKQKIMLEAGVSSVTEFGAMRVKDADIIDIEE